MPFLETPLPGCYIFEPVVWEDDRGYFFESYNQQTFAAQGLDFVFVQDNEAKSVRGVLRGLHYQVGAAAQTKLVRVTEGEVYDVAVDLRQESETYGKWFGTVLSAQNRRQLLVPRGFAHGYLVLSETAVFNYKCDNLYNKDAEGGICYNDPALGVEWPALSVPYQLSPKDELWPPFGQHRTS
ncbi:MAG: dTDP-4-dehydrorhamnose 3,5-epimerase [Bacteroidetes bacterium]|nr:MAG: dTDP-4-dehydrorhamnose 3,5-epimerase [Bacteroidota bacterium]PTM09590.1 MAG: dTDP-4-dehydrorhamnose 3,5-epimerase [Bacteroidota bacterium]